MNIKLPYAFVTIDSESTKDVDDAIFVEATSVGYDVLIAIADPTKLVKIGSTEDAQAKLLGATAYIRDRAVYRMLPPKISEHLSSLSAGQDRPAMIFRVSLGQDLAPIGLTITRSVINVAHRLSYSDVPNIVQDVIHPCHDMLTLATNLARLLMADRRNRGALAMYDLSRMLLADEDGNVQIFHSVEEVIGHILIQEMMILANAEVAKYAVAHNIPCIFRNHKPRLSAPPSGEMASTIEAWINGGTFNTEDVRGQFAAMTEKARYSQSISGHYGLSLPCYLHITSPLRRFADLVNMRQLTAFLKQAPFPYSQSDLETIAADLNETVDRRKEERSEGFKNIVVNTAKKALDSGALKKLADHELRQALKLSRETGYLPEALINEVVRRFDAAIASDMIADALLTEVPSEFLTDHLKGALSRWLDFLPPKSMHMLMHGQQIGFIVEHSIKSSGEGNLFAATGSVVLQDGRRFNAEASANRKKDAEQAVAVQLIKAILGIEVAEFVPTPKNPTPVAVNGNPKGRLLELCQKHGWSLPTFTCEGKGPSNAMVFSAEALVIIAGRTYKARGEGAKTKKDAESLAAQNLYPLIEHLAPTRAAPVTTSTNPVGALQEMAQKGKYPMPEYKFSQENSVTPEFFCEVFTNFGSARTFSGRSSTKQAAKTSAAAEAIRLLG